MGNSDSLADPVELRRLISTGCCPSTASVRASRAISHDFSRVSPLLPRESTCRFRQFSLGQVFQPSPNVQRVGNSITFTRLRVGSLALEPAGLLDSLNEPLSENSVLWVTPHTSLLLHGRTAEFPWPDSNRQAMRRTRHTDDEFIDAPVLNDHCLRQESDPRKGRFRKHGSKASQHTPQRAPLCRLQKRIDQDRQ